MKTVTILFAALLLAGCQGTVSPRAVMTEPYDGFMQDLAMLRDTASVSANDPDSRFRGSSSKAIAAARRVFTQGNLLRKTKEKVLALLGDPKTISTYGVAAKPGKDSPLVYRFDSGYGGWVYTLHLVNGTVTRIEEQGMN